MTAISEFINMVVNDWVGFEPPRFTCNEAELIADVLREERDERTAQRFLYAHSLHDNRDDLHAGMKEPD